MLKVQNFIYTTILECLGEMNSMDRLYRPYMMEFSVVSIDNSLVPRKGMQTSSRMAIIESTNVLSSIVISEGK